MELVREYSSTGCFPLDFSWACFFHGDQKYYGLVSAGKKLFCSDEQTAETIELMRDYQRLIWCGNCTSDCTEYLACISVKQKNEVYLYYLDRYLKEFEVLRLRAEGLGGVEDMWLDKEEQLLYLVFPFSVHKYNLNGDCLGIVMRAPVSTWYRAICMDEDSIFLAYEREGCAYVAEYDRQGIFKEKYSVGSNFSIGNIELVTCEGETLLNLYGRKKGQIDVCQELRIIHCPVKKEICVELITGEGVGETTCYVGCSTEHHKP